MTRGFPFLLSILSRLKEARIQHTLEHNEGSSLLVLANTSQQRWEIQIDEDGNVQVAIFHKDPQVYTEEKLEELFQALESSE